jgi:outer membrane protein
VVTADSSVAADEQSLIASQSNLNYQQQIIKQAIARNLNDPLVAKAPVIPTDRVSLDELPEEKQPIEDLVQEAFKQRPELEQAVLTLKNDEITVKGARNALLPIIDVYGYYGGSGLSGTANPSATRRFCTCAVRAHWGYGTALDQYAFNNTSPDKGVGVNMTIPIRNRARAVGAGAFADGVSAGAVAAGAALHADPHAGDQRAVCADQRPRGGAGG